jgi:hypothetical protein
MSSEKLEEKRISVVEDVSEPAQGVSDESRLESLGYKQDLKREMSMVSVLGLAFCCKYTSVSFRLSDLSLALLTWSLCFKPWTLHSPSILYLERYWRLAVLKWVFTVTYQDEAETWEAGCTNWYLRVLWLHIRACHFLVPWWGWVWAKFNRLTLHRAGYV